MGTLKPVLSETSPDGTPILPGTATGTRHAEQHTELPDAVNALLESVGEPADVATLATLWGGLKAAPRGGGAMWVYRHASGPLPTSKQALVIDGVTYDLRGRKTWMVLPAASEAELPAGLVEAGDILELTAAVSRTKLLVVLGAATPTTSEQTVLDYLSSPTGAHRLTVTTTHDSAAAATFAAETAAAEAVLVLSSALTSDMTTAGNDVHLRDYAKPVMSMAGLLWPIMNMSTGAGDTSAFQVVHIRDAASPLAGGLPAGADHTVHTTNPYAMRYGTGLADSAAQVVARGSGLNPDGTPVASPAVNGFSYDQGATMAAAFAAPHRRLGLSFSTSGFPERTAALTAIFDAFVYRLMAT